MDAGLSAGAADASSGKVATTLATRASGNRMGRSPDRSEPVRCVPCSAAGTLRQADGRSKRDRAFPYSASSTMAPVLRSGGISNARPRCALATGQAPSSHTRSVIERMSQVHAATAGRRGSGFIGDNESVSLSGTGQEPVKSAYRRLRRKHRGSDRRRPLRAMKPRQIAESAALIECGNTRE
jgi:hypothetical protein